MFYKMLAICLIICVVICFVSKYGYCIWNTHPENNIVFHHDFNIEWLHEQIVVVYKLISPITEQLKTVLPTTNRISHWMLGFKLSNGELVICSSSPAGFIELYTAVKQDDNTLYSKQYNSIAQISNKYTHIKKYTLNKFVEIYKRFYISFHRYWLFDENCQKMTSYALHNIFGINSSDTLREKYDMSVISEYFKAMKHKWSGNG